MTHSTIDSGPGFLARSRKALAGGITGLVTGTAGTALVAAIADGVISSQEGWTILAAAVGGFLVGFAGVWAAPANAQS